MGDLRDRIVHDENAFQKLADVIPGFKGYHEQEIRRSADKLLRDHLVGLIEGIRQKLFRFQGELSSRGEFKPVTDLDRISRRLLRAKDRIEHAPYGYAGFLDAVKVDTEALDRLYDFDLALKTNLATIEAAADAALAAPKEEYEVKLRVLADGIDELSRMSDMRSETAADLAP